MHCPACGAEVVEQAVYCHKCGERLDLQEQRVSPGGWAETDPASGRFDPAADEQVSPRAARGAERLQQAAAARQEEADELEKELWQGGYGARAMIGAWAMTALVSVALVVVGIAWPVLHNKTAWMVIVLAILLLWLCQLLMLARHRLSDSYRLTTQRLIHVRGILRRVTERIQVIEIADITVEQKFLERLVGVGTITIESLDRSHPKLPLPGIENVNEVAALMDEARRAEQIRRGVVIEQTSRSE